MILVLKLSLQRIFLGYVVLTYLFNYVQFSKNIMLSEFPMKQLILFVPKFIMG